MLDMRCPAEAPLTAEATVLRMLRITITTGTRWGSAARPAPEDRVDSILVTVQGFVDVQAGSRRSWSVEMCSAYGSEPGSRGN
jgi:hypothetical protein